MFLVLLLLGLAVACGQSLDISQVRRKELGSGKTITYLPEETVVVNTTFFLFTPQNPRKGQLLVADDMQRFEESFLDPTLDTKVIIHGFLQSSGLPGWMTAMKDEFLLKGPYNVLIVDWTGGTCKKEYPQAAANTRMVGQEITRLVNFLANTVLMQPKQFHLIGHCLGAHAAGFAGNSLETVSRITGLDPAEELFQGMPRFMRLDKSDADFVDVIHSDASGVGMSEMVGHVDFFPNEGKDQPGCNSRSNSANPSPLNSNHNSCSHDRAAWLFVTSLNNNVCPFLAYPCPDWDNFQGGKCSSCGSKDDRCAVMGVEAFKSKQLDSERALFIVTGATEDFCEFHYKVTVKLTLKKSDDRNGKLHIQVISKKGSFERPLSQSNENLYQGSTYTYLVTTPDDIGEIISAKFKWIPSKTSWIFKKSIFVEFIEVAPMTLVGQDERQKAKQNLCFNPNTQIKEGDTVTFFPKDTCI